MKMLMIIQNPKISKPRSERYYSCPIWISIGFPSIHQSALTSDGRIDEITRVQRAQQIAAGQCGTAAECCGNAKTLTATSIDRTHTTSRAIRVDVARWEGRTKCVTVDTESCASGGADADTRTTWPAFPKILTTRASAAGIYTCSVDAHAGGTHNPAGPAIIRVGADFATCTSAQLLGWRGPEGATEVARPFASSG